MVDALPYPISRWAGLLASIPGRPGEIKGVIDFKACGSGCAAWNDYYDDTQVYSHIRIQGCRRVL